MLRGRLFCVFSFAINTKKAPVLPFRAVRALSVARISELDGAPQLAEQAAHGWSEDDQAGNCQDGDESNDQAVFDQALRPVPLLLQH